MEKWDLYNKDRERIGQTISFGDIQPKGTYRLIIHVGIFNRDGKLLIQQRQTTKNHWAELWDVSVSGKVQSGETSRQGAEREIAEELGLKIDLSDAVPAFTYSYPQGFGDVFVIRSDLDIDRLRLQEEEVKAVRWASREEVLEMIEKGEFIPCLNGFINLLFDRFTYEGIIRIDHEERYVKGW